MERKGHFPWFHSDLVAELILKYKFLNFYSIAFIHHTSCNYSVTSFSLLTEVMFFPIFPVLPPKEHHTCENSFTHFGSVNDIDDQLS